mgnify:CR=1 FL=1
MLGCVWGPLVCEGAWFFLGSRQDLTRFLGSLDNTPLRIMAKAMKKAAAPAPMKAMRRAMKAMK